MAKPNYQFEKRQKELEKKRKQEEKRLRKIAEKGTEEGESPDQPDAAQASDTDSPPAAE